MTDLFNDPVAFLADEENEDFLRELQNAIPDSWKKPPIGFLFVIGNLITIATILAEIPLIWAEIIIALPALSGNPLAILGEISLIALSGFILNFEVSYWVYIYRVLAAPPGKEVDLDLNPLSAWGLANDR